MPVQVSYPGVYIEEVPSSVHTITGVATSIAAFLGRTAKGPLDRAVRCLSLTDFERSFGGPHPESDLAHSVRMFFENGGGDCYVVRLAAGAANANVTLRDLSDDAETNPYVLVVTAKTAGAWGNGLRLEVDYRTSNPDEAFNLSVVQLDGNTVVSRERHESLSMDPESARFAPRFVSQRSDMIDLALHEDVAPAEDGSSAGPRDLTNPDNGPAGYSQSRPFSTADISASRTEFEALLTSTPQFEISVDESGFLPVSLANVLGEDTPAIAPGSWDLGQMATRLTAVINERLGASRPGLQVDCEFVENNTSADVVALRITAASGQRRSVRIRRSASDDFAGPMMLGVDQGGIEVTRHSHFRPVPTAAFFHNPDNVIQLAALAGDPIGSLQIDGGPTVWFDFPSPPPGSDDLWFVDSRGNSDGIREKLRVIAQAVSDAPDVPWRGELWGYHLALIAEEGTLNATASAVESETDTTLGAANFTRNVRQYALGPTGAGPYQQSEPEPTTGSDGTAPTATEFLGSEANQTGFHALDPVDLFNLMVIPVDEGVSEATHSGLWGPASRYCAQRRALLLIDAPASWTRNGRAVVVNNTPLVDVLRGGVVTDHAAVFYPRVRVRNDGNQLCGPAGAIAGLMARTDTTRGVWKAPAGTEADLRGILGLEVSLTDKENGVLNKQGVNCLRSMAGSFVNWGARTLDGADDRGSQWKYIPIRRLALFIEESLYRGTRWVVFEPNDEPLWAKVRLNLGAYMMRLFRQGAFQGSTPNQAFFVKCDAETTTQADRNLGIVNIIVGFAPLKPAEFVIIKIQQIAGEL